VLHHADKPELYHGLPKDPAISTAVTLWKGVWKPLAAIGFAVTFAASAFHFLGVGPNYVKDEEPGKEEEHVEEEHDEEKKP